MTLANGRDYLAIPGPSVMPERVLRAMQRTSPNIYEGELHSLTDGMIPDLRRVAGTDGYVAIYIGNGHAAWEAALCNTCSRGDRVLIAVTGAFARGWAEMAEGLGLVPQLIEFDDPAPVDPERVADALRADTGHAIRAVLVVHVDTSTSVRSDVAAVSAAVRATGHPALVMADCIASLGCDRFEMDAWGVDVMISASQKGLMTPPGLAFVWFNDRAAAARDGADLASRYWDWGPRANPEAFWQYFDGTAPTHHLYALREALDMIGEEGLPAIWARHERLARAVWAAVDHWGQGGPIRLNVPDPAQRSHAVTTLCLPDGAATRLRGWCEDKAGVTLGIGLGKEPYDDWFRIGHMGHVNAHMVLGTLGVIEAGMRALDVPFAEGGLGAAAQVISEA